MKSKFFLLCLSTIFSHVGLASNEEPKEEKKSSETLPLSSSVNSLLKKVPETFSVYSGEIEGLNPVSPEDSFLKGIGKFDSEFPSDKDSELKKAKPIGVISPFNAPAEQESHELVGSGSSDLKKTISEIIENKEKEATMQKASNIELDAKKKE